MIWHSLAEDDANNAFNLAPPSPADDAVSPPPPVQKNPPKPGDVPLRDSSFDRQSRPGSGSSNSTVVVSPGADGRSGNNQSSDFTGARSTQDKRGSDTNNYFSSGRHLREANKHDGGVLVPSNEKNISREDDAKLAYRHQEWAAGGVAPDTGTTVGAACALASDLSRLASRHGELAFGLLHVSEGRGSDPRSFAGLPGEMAALGQSVGLQASAVGLMEEVVVRTVHSRVRDGSIDCSCRV